ncbi:PhzF family phenazine biosynthesis protein [Psychromonas arctica]|uniref:PhzF family phenazine biosynthesis protein n=1 Tax=Psychromonas arctica TaxID=168275 RepID=UPI002FD4C6AD
MELTIYVVDAFTDQQFQGNSAAVIPLTEWLNDDAMQNIATENNLSETAFIVEISKGRYEIRWFSPITEIDFCGHATLASAFVLFNELGVIGDIEFVTLQVGSLTVRQGKNRRIEMSFPNQKPHIIEEVPQALSEGLSIQPLSVLQNRQAYVVVLGSVQEVLDVTYQSDLLKQLSPFDVVVTASHSIKNDNVADHYDFVSRYFWPANGGDEDPVTGSIHAGLAPYWANELNKQQLTAYQASKRGGTLYCDVNEERVLISGFGILYLKGTIYI